MRIFAMRPTCHGINTTYGLLIIASWITSTTSFGFNKGTIFWSLVLNPSNIPVSIAQGHTNDILRFGWECKSSVRAELKNAYTAALEAT